MNLEYNIALFGFFEVDNPGKPRLAEEFGFKADNYYTADQKRLMHNREGNMVSGTFSHF